MSQIKMMSWIIFQAPGVCPNDSTIIQTYDAKRFPTHDDDPMLFLSEGLYSKLIVMKNYQYNIKFTLEHARSKKIEWYILTLDSF